MTREFDISHTAVFHIGSLAAEEPRSYDVDEPTRELPLIAGRFAGREWTVEAASAPAEKKPGKGRSLGGPLAAALATALAVALLIGSLLDQTEIVELNEDAVALSGEIADLREEQEELLLRREELRPAMDLEQLAGEMIPEGETAGEDRATVLNIRHGRELGHLWESLVDTLGASFR